MDTEVRKDISNYFPENLEISVRNMRRNTKPDYDTGTITLNYTRFNGSIATRKFVYSHHNCSYNSNATPKTFTYKFKEVDKEFYICIKYILATNVVKVYYYADVDYRITDLIIGVGILKGFESITLTNNAGKDVFLLTKFDVTNLDNSTFNLSGTKKINLKV